MMSKKGKLKTDFIRLYHTTGCSKFIRRSKNAVYFNSGSSTKHELAKAVGGLMLLRWGDINFEEEILEKLEELSEEIDKAMLLFPRQKANFITEAVPNNEGSRRVDLVNIDDNTRYEFESNSKIKKDNCITIYI